MLRLLALSVLIGRSAFPDTGRMSQSGAPGNSSLHCCLSLGNQSHRNLHTDLKDEIGIIPTAHSSTTIEPTLLRHLDLVSALDKLARPAVSIGRLIFPPSNAR